MKKLFEVVQLNYKTFETERRPRIGIYYFFPKKLEGAKKQAIQTNSVDRMSFSDISQVVANLHGDDFFKTNDWLEGVEVD